MTFLFVLLLFLTLAPVVTQNAGAIGSIVINLRFLEQFGKYYQLETI
ncbi:unnamed protein product [Ectocarpus sp. 6 AP-2014]